MKTLAFALGALVFFNSSAQAAESLLRLEIRADFAKVAEKNAVVDDESEDSKKSTQVAGSLRDLAHPDRLFQIELRARGNTSRAQGEADFPKLRVEFPKTEELKGSAFAGNRSFRINTHLSDKKKITGMGRMAGDAGPLRETLAYHLADILGLATPNARLAKIDYIDSKTNRTLTHFAMLIESTKTIGKRLAGKEIDEQTLAQGDSSQIDPVLGAKFFLFHKLIANNDIQLRINEEPTMTTELNRAIWNSFVFEMPNGSRIPVVYDLDLAGMLNGRILKSNLVDRVSPLFEHFTKTQLTAALDQISAKKTELYSKVETATVDEDGRKIARTALDTFFSEIQEVLASKIIASEGVRFFADANLTIDKLRENSVSADGIGTLRLGTPVRILERVGNVLKVEIVPIKYVLKEKESSVGFIRAETAIADSLTLEQVRTVDSRDMSF